MERWEIVRAFITGPLVEVALPKPGNVNRFRDFRDLSVYNFLVAYPALVGIYHETVRRGELIRSGVLSPAEAGLGELIRRSAEATRRVQSGNPDFGVLVLSIPLIAGLALTKKLSEGGEKARLLLEESSVRDTMELYRAIRILEPKGIPRGVKYDVYSEDAFEELFRDRVNLMRLAELSCPRETIFCEWLNSYGITYGAFSRILRLAKEMPLEDASVRLFLELLAERGDTLIRRKAGEAEELLVRKRAREVIEGKLSIEEFDAFLREEGDLRNPGSTADIVAVALSLVFLSGVGVEMKNGRAWLTARP
ncbi:triphosphoribosyl-dephospho-CoA synthase [Thermococcus sp.]|uniref:triphosphoribosyl-dephospho-CoA synthase n=1 Tax=Thermococcus sp. TaxID=35749 RepID=UPI00262D07F4|nr:triphosphoribosyl-dephospho-CoA synthase [Thermococcus sp.]